MTISLPFGEVPGNKPEFARLALIGIKSTRAIADGD